ncbi:MAG TPA: preprotein translocase subunit YajC [Sedimenticola thiotaurini]|uniref:Sec translocon accessory complex subunit YajC n=1 Tax=Sedimenticola thiotaurini TaxID=1543721 RepID=A0A831W8I8_9GAMM|nr:preprotein translocase subunit YajC [Sedimenticola thiotaurini]
MSFFISDAMAQAASGGGAAGQPGLEGLILPIGLIVLLYFLMIRPQMKRQKEHKKLVEALAKGDEVQTEGGMMGKIVDIGDNFVKLEVAEGTVITLRRQSIVAVMPKGTLKEL